MTMMEIMLYLGFGCGQQCCSLGRGRGDKKILCRYPPLQLLSLPVGGGVRNVLGVQLLLSAEKALGVKVVKDRRTPKSCLRTKLGVNCF